MIFRAFLIALGLLLFSPAQAKAEPITAILIAIGISASTAAAVTTAIVTAVVGGIVATGLSMAASAIFGQKKPTGSPIRPVANRSREVIDNVVGTVEYIPVVYGQTKVGGLKAFTEVKDSDLYQVIVFCEGEVDSIVSYEIDGVPSTDVKFNDLVESWNRLGTDEQEYIPEFAADAPGWSSSHRGRGLCYLALKFSKDSDVFPRIPVITAVIKGKKVLDPRSGLVEWSDNPALCILDYLKNKRYGKGLHESKIDLDSFIAAANYYDQLVDGLKRFTLNGYVKTDQTILDNLDEMLTSCNSILTFYNGKHRLKPMRAEGSVYTFTKDNIIGPLNIERLGKRDKKNRADVNWMNPNNNWQGDLAIVQNDSFYVADGQQERTLNIELPFTTVGTQANYIGQLAVNQSRLDTKVSFKSTQQALQVEIADVVGVTHPTPGWNQKLFRVNALGLEPDGNVVVTLEEYDSDVYNVTPITEEDLGTSSNFQSPFVIDPPGVPLISQQFRTNTVGDIQNVIRLDYTRPLSGFVSEYQIEYKEVSALEYTIVGRTQNQYFEIVDMVPALYNFRVKAVNTAAASSKYSYALAEVVNDTSVPTDVNNFQIVSTGGALLATWEAVDMAFGGGKYIIKHSPKTTGADWNDPVNFTIDVSGRERKVTLGLIEGTYMIKAVNLAGIPSANTAYIVVNLPSTHSYSLVNTVTEDTTYTGSKTNMLVTSEGKLTLDGTITIDDKAGLFDDAGGLFDDGGGRALTGSYSFVNTTSLPGNFFIRLVKDFTANYLDASALFDDRDGLIDDQPGFFDGEENNTVQLFLEYRSRPNALAAWSSWQPLNVNDITAKDLEYRLTVTTDFSYQNIEFETLRVKVYMLRTNRAGSNQPIAIGGTTINFNPAFYQAPTVVASILDVQQGDYYKIENVTRSSCKITCYDVTNSSVARSVNWQAYGVGEELT